MNSKCSYEGCEKEAEYLPVHQLPLCEEHYKLHRFIQTIFLMTKWEPRWKDWADEEVTQ